MSPDALGATLGDEDFVLLTTFRRNGEGVPTPVWISRVADQARIGPVEATAEMVPPVATSTRCRAPSEPSTAGSARSSPWSEGSRFVARA